jgi:hypothetical protein
VLGVPPGIRRFEAVLWRSTWLWIRNGRPAAFPARAIIRLITGTASAMLAAAAIHVKPTVASRRQERLSGTKREAAQDGMPV